MSVDCDTRFLLYQVKRVLVLHSSSVPRSPQRTDLTFVSSNVPAHSLSTSPASHTSISSPQSHPQTVSSGALVPPRVPPIHPQKHSSYDD